MSPPLKLLMLHGYTQSGPLFHAKSRALIKHITKAFPSHEVSAVYPTGPLRLKPADIPGYTPAQEETKSTTTTIISSLSSTTPQSNSNDNDEDDNQIEAYGWFRRSNTADPPLYVGLEDGLDAVAKVLREEGPFDGVIGFSQGAAMAAMVASLLETGRAAAFERFSSSPSSATSTSTSTSSSAISVAAEEGTTTGGGGVPGFSYPESFAQLSHPPLKFALCYSGFRSPGERYRAFYEEPAIQTPVLHVLGSLDAVVDEARSRALVDACEGDPEKEGRVIFHPGGHFVPSQRPYLDAVVRFVREVLDGQNSKVLGDEEDVNDMDLPF